MGQPALPSLNHMTVLPRKAFNALGSQLTTNLHDTVEIWTADSHLLNELIFIGGMEDGEKMFRRSTPPTPAFSEKTNTLELAEFVQSVLASGTSSAATEFDLPYPVSAASAISITIRARPKLKKL